MAKKTHTTKPKVTSIHGKKYACKPVGGAKGSKAAYKKCLLTTIRLTKISTPKSAQRAFSKAARHCKALLTGVTPQKRKKTPRKPRSTRGAPKSSGWGSGSAFNRDYTNRMARGAAFLARG